MLVKSSGISEFIKQIEVCTRVVVGEEDVLEENKCDLNCRTNSSSNDRKEGCLRKGEGKIKDPT